ncbi:hypothetical protein J1605_007908 [Eschrichtius robustus]|uniref:Helicase C-terminal domain-containing protein n=1 Tax=Eschrichtius robustus TaxID=9764 RepID=A0AB34GWB2_ESCRO|nr:hypothetical protein J1605_007908 [Eschrichtius robustus]
MEREGAATREGDMPGFLQTLQSENRVEAARARVQEQDLRQWGLTGIHLRPYQLEGVNWLAQRFHCQNGCILGDEMGLVVFNLLLTGTPIQNSLRELYSLLSFVEPDLFSKEQVEDFIQRYQDIEKESESDAFENEMAKKVKLQNVLSQLRKCVDHPYLFDGVEPEPFEIGDHLIEASGKLHLLDKLLAFLYSKGHRVLLFSQMTQMLDILQDYMDYRGYSYERVDGSVRGEERHLAIKNFGQQPIFIFLLSTRAGGVGMNLTAADTVIFVDSDFNPQNDLQAAARAHRIGQNKSVKVIRLIGRDTVEEIVCRKAASKLQLTSTITEGGHFTLGAQKPAADADLQLSEILKFGLDKLLSSEGSTMDEIDLESILGETKDGQWISGALPTAEERSREQEEGRP